MGGEISKAFRSIGDNCYPLLFSFAWGLCLDLSSSNACPTEQVISLCITISFVALIFQVLALLIFREPWKAAIGAVLFILWIFSFGPFCLIISYLYAFFKHLPPSVEFELTLYSLIGIAVFLSAFKASKSLFVLSSIRTIIIVFFLLELGTEIIRIIPINQLSNKAIIGMSEKNGKIELSTAHKPDIYYIILDSAICESTLHNLYHMQNIDFFDYLKQKGFYIGIKSKSNYDCTKFSLPSSLNFSYINYLGPLLKGTDGNIVFSRLIQQSLVIRSLKELGYKIVNVRSGFSITEYNPDADYNVGMWFGNRLLLGILMELTIVNGLEDDWDIVGNILRAKESWPFSHITEIQKIKGPKFVFIHILLPHPPFLFTADGAKLPLTRQIHRDTYEKRYRDQIIYTFKNTQKMLETLLSVDKDKLPIIVIQGDHGSALNSDQWPYSQAYLKERFGILNTYFFPDQNYSLLYNSISPVNSFRVIFNQYFHTHLPLLPDTSYYAPPEPSFDWVRWKGNNESK